MSVALRVSAQKRGKASARQKIVHPAYDSQFYSMDYVSRRFDSSKWLQKFGLDSISASLIKVRLERSTMGDCCGDIPDELLDELEDESVSEEALEGGKTEEALADD